MITYGAENSIGDYSGTVLLRNRIAKEALDVIRGPMQLTCKHCRRIWEQNRISVMDPYLDPKEPTF